MRKDFISVCAKISDMLESRDPATMLELNIYLDFIERLINYKSGDQPILSVSGDQIQTEATQQSVPGSDLGNKSRIAVQPEPLTAVLPDMPGCASTPTHAHYAFSLIWQSVVLDFCLKNPLLRRYFDPVEIASIVESGTASIPQIFQSARRQAIQAAQISAYPLKTASDPENQALPYSSPCDGVSVIGVNKDTITGGFFKLPGGRSK